MRPGLAVALLLCALPARAQEVPPQLALALMLKVVTYDVGFKARGDGEFVVLVPAGPGQAEKAKELQALGSSLTIKSINQRALRFVIVAPSELSAAKGSAVLLYPGFPADLARQLVQAATKDHLYTLAFEEELVRDGVMIGVTSNEGKPQVVVNITTARHAGVELASAVLKVARTVQ